MDLVKKNSNLLLISLLLLSFFLFFFRLGDRSLRNPDEGRYAEIAREMALTGNWIEPKLYGLDYLSKPPLFYWLTTIFVQRFGFTEASARAVPAVFGFLGVVMTYFFARRYFGLSTALCSSLILTTNIWYLQTSRYLVIDAVFSFFLVGAFFSFYAFLRDDKRVFLFLFYIFSALAFLAKGIAGAAIPLFVTAVYFGILRHWREGLLRSISPSGFLFFLCIVLPWFFLVTLRHPGFLESFFWHEHVSRYLSKGFEHQEPWYFYFALLPLIFLPWSLFAPTLKGVFTSERGFTKDRRLYLWVMTIGILLFYSLSRSKLATYMLPVIPPAAILLGEAWSNWLQETPGAKRINRGSWITIALVGALVFSAVIVILSPVIGFKFPQRIPTELRPLVLSGLLIIFFGFGFIFYSLITGQRLRVFLAALLCLCASSVVTTLAMEGMNRNYTTKPFAQFLRPLLVRGERVFIYGQPGAFYDFAYYLNYPVTPVGLEGEFEKLLHQAGTEGKFVSTEEWKEIFLKERAYCLMRLSDYEGLDEASKHSMDVLMQDQRKVLVMSLGLSPAAS